MNINQTKVIEWKLGLLFCGFVLCFALPKSMSQLQSNEYFEVLDSTLHSTTRIFPISEGHFIEKSLKSGPTFYSIKGQEKIEIPCEDFKVLYNQGKQEYNYFRCYNNDEIALFSIEKFAPITPFYDSIMFVDKNFYVVWQSDSLYIYNSQNDLLYISESTISLKKARRKIRYCYEDLLHCSMKDDEFYLNTKGEVFENIICSNLMIANTKYKDGSYKFRIGDKWGIKNEDGSVLFEAIYRGIFLWQEGKYIVTFEKSENQKIGYSVVDKDNVELIPKSEDSYISTVYGLIAEREDKYAFLDTDLKDKYEILFDRILVHECGFLEAKVGDEVYYDLLFTDKNEVLDGGIESVSISSDSTCQVKYTGGKFVLYDKVGNVVFEPQEKSDGIKQLGTNLFSVWLGLGNVGLVNSNNEWILEPGNYKFTATENKENFFVRYNDTKVSNMIDAKGTVLCPNVAKTRNNYAGNGMPKVHYLVGNEKGKGVISQKGELIIPIGDYDIYEFHRFPQYYRLTKGDMDYIIELK